MQVVISQHAHTRKLVVHVLELFHKLPCLQFSTEAVTRHLIYNSCWTHLNKW